MTSNDILVRQFIDSLPYDKEFMEGFIFLNNYTGTVVNTLTGGFYGYIDDPELQEFLDLIDGNGYYITTRQVERSLYFISTKRIKYSEKT